MFLSVVRVVDIDPSEKSVRPHLTSGKPELPCQRMKRGEKKGERLVRVSEETHLRLRLFAASRDVTLGQAVAVALGQATQDEPEQEHLSLG